MTANSDFKRFVRQRMADTDEPYKQARDHVARETQQQINEMFRQFRETDGDYMEREKFLIEAANLATTIEGHMLDRAFVPSVLWMIPKHKRMPMLNSFLLRDDLTIDDQAWAREHRLIVLAIVRNEFKFQAFVDEHLAFMDWVAKNLAPERQAIAFSNSSVWGWWLEQGRDDILEKMDHCLTTIPATEGNKQDRLYLARDITMSIAYRQDPERLAHYQNIWQRILDEPGELPDMGPGSRVVIWQFWLKITSLMSAKGDRERAGVAAAEIVDWIRRLGDSDELIGEVAAQCMFQEQYDLAEQYGAEAIERGQAEKNAYIYVWHAGGHLGATGDVGSTVPLMEEARRHISAQDMERFLTDQIPFTEYKKDPRLRAIAEMRARSA